MLGRVRGVQPGLGVTPVGGLEPFGTAFGDARARPELLRQLRARIPHDVGSVRFGIVHVALPQIVEPVTAELRAMFGPQVEVLSAPATPVLATHTGVGAWGVAYLVED